LHKDGLRQQLTNADCRYGRQSAVHRLPELRGDMVEMECDPREGLDDSESDDDDEVANCSQAPQLE
jgi:hypothetical protein